MLSDRFLTSGFSASSTSRSEPKRCGYISMWERPRSLGTGRQTCVPLSCSSRNRRYESPLNCLHGCPLRSIDGMQMDFSRALLLVSEQIHKNASRETENAGASVAGGGFVRLHPLVSAAIHHQQQLLFSISFYMCERYRFGQSSITSSILGRGSSQR